MFEIILFLAILVCAADLALMYRKQKRAQQLADGEMQATAPGLNALARRAAFYLVAVVIIYNFGGWLSIG